MAIFTTDLFPYQTNTIDTYDRLCHTRQYIGSKVLEIPQTKTRFKGTRFDEVREFCGYREMHTFIKHVHEWNSLKSLIPERYLIAMGIDLDVLESTLERDRIRYFQKLQEPRYPKVFHVRSGPVLLTRGLPDVSEEDAISYIQDLTGGRPVPCQILYDDFLAIQVVSGKAPAYTYKIPSVHTRGGLVGFQGSGDVMAGSLLSSS